MKKYLLTGSMIILFALYLGYERFSVLPADVANNLAIPQDYTTIPMPSGNSSSSSTSRTGIYKDGTYVGSRADAYYGYIQVEAVIKNGQIADVQFLEHPSDQRESIQINSRAMPVLRSEAISAQSANVSIVSRATDSSQAFRQSLASALAQAS